MSSASRFRCNSMHRFGSRSLKQALDTGFLGRSLSRRRRPSEAMERLEQRSGPAPPDHGPVPGCPVRLPEPSRKGGGSSRSRGREPSAAPRRGEGSAGRPPFSNPPINSATPERRGPATGPVIARQARDERLGCPPPPQRRPCRSAHSALPRHRHGHRRRYVTRRPSCHPAPSPGPSA